MAEQMRHLADVARRPNVTVQILPAVAHPAGASGFIVTDGAAYAEHVAGGFTYTDEETVSSLLRLFNSIQVESFKASESMVMIEEVGEIWTGGKSSYSNANGGDCVEVADGARGGHGARHHQPRRRNAGVRR